MFFSQIRVIQFFLQSIEFLDNESRQEFQLRRISPIPRDGRRIGDSAFVSRYSKHYGSIFAAKWSINSRLEAVVSK